MANQIDLIRKIEVEKNFIANNENVETHKQLLAYYQSLL